MSYKTHGLTYQVRQAMHDMLRIGQSRHKDKQEQENDRKLSDSGIYSYGSLHKYTDACVQFTRWVKAEHEEVRSIQDCRPFVNDYLQHRIDKGESAWTIKADASALGKLYQCPTTDFIDTPARHRVDIKRSRTKTKQDKHFSLTRNADIIEFGKSTGLRRNELRTVRGCYLTAHDDGSYTLQIKGKGGRIRDLPVRGNIELVVRLCTEAGENRVFAKVPKNMDQHSNRRYYAQQLYKDYARPIEQVPYRERYYCRSDMKGVIYDRKAMERVSKALGHSRITVIAENYL